MELFKSILEFNNKKRLIEENDIIVVGFSGGPDSVFLTEMLLKLQKVISFKFYLVHINHMLRGEDANLDEFFSCEYAKKNKLEIFHKRINISEIAKKNKKTFEEVGREERYKFFKEISKLISANKIATAHNKDDQVETFLFKLIRGSSLQGLEGINSNKFNIIRPISEIYKDDILNYLNKNKIQYRIDKTNFENEYTRNSIRLDLIPFIEKRYNSKFKDKIYSLIEEIRENNIQNSLSLKNYINEDNKIKLDVLLNLSSFNIKQLLSKFLTENNISVNRKKIEEIFSILNKNGTKKIDLDLRHKLIKDYNYIYIEKKVKEHKNVKSEVIFKVFDNFQFNNYYVKSKLYEENIDKPDKNNIILTLPLDAELKLRYRQEGDKIILTASKGTITKKVKDIFINEKIPKDTRENIPILLYENEIVWIVGVKKGSISKNKSKNYEQILFSMKEVSD
ncbi:tRNA lysidine(34) synthetase TilS [Fusobacterium russii]|uniref:tRNA lysidine(34) synthetase TilS n=1 Tax=Fusobacterium russii TaxID=854 RepID=UPI0003A2326A|nr:tRNA lysidine(34) synthetase TilS [Fusobacterium russii]